MLGVFGQSHVYMFTKCLCIHPIHLITLKLNIESTIGILITETLQSIMNVKLCQQRFWHCHENKTVKPTTQWPDQVVPKLNQYVSCCCPLQQSIQVHQREAGVETQT